jgi:hypothetical protein
MAGRASCYPWLLTLAVSACDCDHEQGSPVLFNGGTTQDGLYQTSDWQGPWLHFPGGRRYVLQHGLGRSPTQITPYLAFHEYPLDGGDAEDAGSSLSPGSGDTSLIERVDSQQIVIRNGTCSEFFLRVVARAGD